MRFITDSDSSLCWHAGITNFIGSAEVVSHKLGILLFQFSRFEELLKEAATEPTVVQIKTSHTLMTF